MAQLIRVKLTKSPVKVPPRQLATLKGIGLRKLQQQKILPDTPANRGMIFKMQHMLDVECFEGDVALIQSARRRDANAQKTK